MHEVLAGRGLAESAAAVFLPDGRLLASSQSLPAGGLPLAVQGILGEFAAGAMAAGDGYLTNDPWRGGTHLPDLVLLRPVVAQGAVQALLACVLHHQDVGGMAPGSLPPDATSVHQEGLRVPPVQLYRQGQTEPTLLRLLCTNSRAPDALAADLRAQWAALQAGEAALQPLLVDAAAFARDGAAAIAASEAATRAALRAVPDGDYACDDALDGDGISPEPVRIAVRLRKAGDTLTIDLTGCAAQTAGPANTARAAVWAAVSQFMRAVAPQAAANAGCLAPVQLKLAPGTVLDPAFPAAINARTSVVSVLLDALLAAWAQAGPQQPAAQQAGAAVVVALGGQLPGGTPWLFKEVVGGAGVLADEAPPGLPLRLERAAARRGSGGAGRQRGADGVVRVYRLLRGSGTIAYQGERHRIPSPGRAGGQPGVCGSARIERADGRVDWLQARACADWNAGDVLVVETAGGGGWGPAT